MEYKENMLCCEDYYRLRESVDWLNFSEQQAQKALNRSLYLDDFIPDYWVLKFAAANGRYYANFHSESIEIH